jgi:hypothetical protein
VNWSANLYTHEDALLNTMEVAELS